jgi:hypothetical protein
LVTAGQQLRKRALLGNGWPQQYQGRVFYGVGSQAINPREIEWRLEILRMETEIVFENGDLESSFVRWSLSLRRRIEELMARDARRML